LKEKRPFPLLGGNPGRAVHSCPEALLLSVGPDPVVVEQMLVGGELRCPDCGGGLARWGWVAARFVRVLAGGVVRVRLRRAICSVGVPGVDGCGRSHVLLPRTALGRRLDEVGLIWSVLQARAGGWGWRRVAEWAGRPASTVRGWLARFAERAQVIRQGFADLERLVSAADGGDMDRLVPAGGLLGDAVAQIGACLAALRRSWGASVFTVSPAQVVAVLSGGWLLGRRGLRATGLWINTSPRL
jgi:hypothetical protein